MGAAAIPLVTTAFSIFSSVQEGKAAQAEAKSEAKFQSKQAKADADAEMAAANIQAKKIRDMARSQRGSARAALAASGVDVGEGSAVAIDKQITGDAESDASMTIFGGKDVQNRGYQQAEAANIIGKKQAAQAKSKMLSGVFGAVGQGADGFHEKGGWKSMRDTFSSKG